MKIYIKSVTFSLNADTFFHHLLGLLGISIASGAARVTMLAIPQ